MKKGYQNCFIPVNCIDFSGVTSALHWFVRRRIRLSIFILYRSPLIKLLSAYWTYWYGIVILLVKRLCSSQGDKLHWEFMHFQPIRLQPLSKPHFSLYMMKHVVIFIQSNEISCNKTSHFAINLTHTLFSSQWSLNGLDCFSVKPAIKVPVGDHTHL